MLRLFFLYDPAATEIYTLSLHDALPISSPTRAPRNISAATAAASSFDFAMTTPFPAARPSAFTTTGACRWARDRKSTRLNSSHTVISYAVFCLKKKNQHQLHIEVRHPIK